MLRVVLKQCVGPTGLSWRRGSGLLWQIRSCSRDSGTSSSNASHPVSATGDKPSVTHQDLQGTVKAGSVIDESKTSKQPPCNVDVEVPGFSEAFDKFESLRGSDGAMSGDGGRGGAAEEDSFEFLLRNSKLMQLGSVENKVVTGEIYHVVGDDLYVDFGGKLPAVVARPRHRGDEYGRGARVRLLLHDLEMSSRFLGHDRDITLLEADATLLGLLARRPPRATTHRPPADDTILDREPAPDGGAH